MIEPRLQLFFIQGSGNLLVAAASLTTALHRLPYYAAAALPRSSTSSIPHRVTTLKYRAEELTLVVDNRCKYIIVGLGKHLQPTT
ncbi:hypothetical protein TMatcc_009305 [Talaromyces marneffei ATCC 18224]